MKRTLIAIGITGLMLTGITGGLAGNAIAEPPSNPNACGEHISEGATNLRDGNPDALAELVDLAQHCQSGQ